MTTITTAAELDALPPLSVWIDSTDSIGFRGDSGLFCLPQIGRPVNWRAAQEIIDLCADYGALPLTVLYRPDQPEPVKPSREDVARAIAAHSGPMGTHYFDVALAAADAVLALLPGRCAPTEAEVEECLFGLYDHGASPNAKKEARTVVAPFAAQPTVREAKAEAWDAGWVSATVAMAEGTPANPYRSEADHG